MYHEINKNRVEGEYFDADFIDIGSKFKLNYLRKNSKFLKNKCFFLDRDGVINKDVGYLKSFKNDPIHHPDLGGVPGLRQWGPFQLSDF